MIPSGTAQKTGRTRQSQNYQLDSHTIGTSMIAIAVHGTWQNHTIVTTSHDWALSSLRWSGFRRGRRRVCHGWLSGDRSAGHRYSTPPQDEHQTVFTRNCTSRARTIPLLQSTRTAPNSSSTSSLSRFPCKSAAPPVSRSIVASSIVGMEYFELRRFLCWAPPSASPARSSISSHAKKTTALRHALAQKTVAQPNSTACSMSRLLQERRASHPRQSFTSASTVALRYGVIHDHDVGTIDLKA